MTKQERRARNKLYARMQQLEDMAPHDEPPSEMDVKVISLYQKHIGTPDENVDMEDRLDNMTITQIETLIIELERVVL